MTRKTWIALSYSSTLMLNIGITATALINVTHTTDFFNFCLLWSGKENDSADTQVQDNMGHSAGWNVGFWTQQRWHFCGTLVNMSKNGFPLSSPGTEFTRSTFLDVNHQLMSENEPYTENIMKKLIRSKHSICYQYFLYYEIQDQDLWSPGDPWGGFQLSERQLWVCYFSQQHWQSD